MSIPIANLKAALEDYAGGVRDARTAALEARARIARAAAVLGEIREAVLQRRRRAGKRAAKRGLPRS